MRRFLCECVSLFTTACKRKRVVLSLADKLNIIQQSHKGATGEQLIEMECAGQSRKSKIKRSERKYLSFVSGLENEDEITS